MTFLAVLLILVHTVGSGVSAIIGAASGNANLLYQAVIGVTVVLLLIKMFL